MGGTERIVFHGFQSVECWTPRKVLYNLAKSVKNSLFLGNANAKWTNSQLDNRTMLNKERGIFLYLTVSKVPNSSLSTSVYNDSDLSTQLVAMLLARKHWLPTPAACRG